MCVWREKQRRAVLGVNSPMFHEEHGGITSSLVHPLAALLLLGHSIRDGMMGSDALASLLDQSLGGFGIA